MCPSFEAFASSNLSYFSFCLSYLIRLVSPVLNCYTRSLSDSFSPSSSSTLLSSKKFCSTIESDGFYPRLSRSLVFSCSNSRNFFSRIRVPSSSARTFRILSSNARISSSFCSISLLNSRLVCRISYNCRRSCSVDCLVFSSLVLELLNSSYFS